MFKLLASGKTVNSRINYVRNYQYIICFFKYMFLTGFYKMLAIFFNNIMH